MSDPNQSNPRDADDISLPHQNDTKSSNRDLPTFQEAMQHIVSDLADAAIQIREDRFQAKGIGKMGTLFRTASAAMSTEAEDETWSSILELASILWRESYHEASVRLLKDAQLRLSPPETYRSMIEESIAYGEDYLLYLKAKARFDQGDSEGARGIIGKMSEESRGKMEQELTKRSKARRDSRRFAFIAAGIACGFCAIASVVSFFLLRDLVENPHTVSLPDFEMPPELTQALGGGDRELLPSSSMNAIPDAQGESSSNGNASQLDPLTDRIDTSERDPSEDFLQEDLASPETPTPALNLKAQPVTPSPLEPLERPEQRDKPDPVDPDLISRCGLALRISVETQRLAAATEDRGDDDQSKKFRETFMAACGSIPAAVIQEAGKSHAHADIKNYAESILKSD